MDNKNLIISKLNYKNKYSSDLPGYFIYSISLESNLEYDYHRCVYPEKCANKINNLIDIKNIEASYYKFIFRVQNIYYVNDDYVYNPLKFIPIQNINATILTSINIMSISHFWDRIFQNDIYTSFKFKNVYEFFKMPNKSIIECPHTKTDINNIIGAGLHNFKLIENSIIKIKDSLKSIHQKLGLLVTYFTEEEIILLHKQMTNIKELQTNLYETSKQLSKKRLSINTDCPICFDSFRIDPEKVWRVSDCRTGGGSGGSDDDECDTDVYTLSGCNHGIHLDCLIKLNNSVRDRFYEPGDLWSFEDIKQHFFCPYCRKKMSLIDVITSVKKKQGILL